MATETHLPRQNPAPRTALGLRGQKGGAVIVAVAVEGSLPRLLLSTSLRTHVEGDRLSLEPYRVAAEIAEASQDTASARAAAAEGRLIQDRLAAEGLHEILDRLGSPSVVAALLVNRAGWITDLLDYSLAWAEHVPVAEGLAVRDALRFGLGRCAVETVELDEKSLAGVAAEALGMPPDEIDAQIKAMGAAAGKPWRKEQKLACLAAWIAGAGRR